MKIKFTSIDEVRSALEHADQAPAAQRKFPRELWTSIIQLTKTHSLPPYKYKRMTRRQNG